MDPGYREGVADGLCGSEGKVVQERDMPLPYKCESQNCCTWSGSLNDIFRTKKFLLFVNQMRDIIYSPEI